MLKILSYNVNGLRAVIGKGFNEWLSAENPDIICLQETKIQEGQVDTSVYEKMSYKHFWHYAQKKGYSGVCLLSKITPVKVSYGIGVDEFDNEGRTVVAYFNDFAVVSVYFPSGSSGDVRQEVKMRFLDAFLIFLEKLRKEQPNVIVSGDYNICHKAIDINHPERHQGYSGFLPEERAWMDAFVNLGMVDTFRVFNQQAEQYSWWSYRAGSKGKNLGWRIDYHMASAPLREKLKNAFIMPQVLFSDHCPVGVELEV